MKVIRMAVGVILACFIMIYALPPNGYLPVSKITISKWGTDSCFLGATPATYSDTSLVKVKWKGAYSDGLGKLFFMVPGHSDSVLFLFHNLIDSFPGEEKEIVLGNFPVNTELFFMYQVVDTNGRYKNFAGKKYYSGYNREGIEPYISDLRGSFSYKWAVAGKLDSTRVEVGFEDDTDARFNAVIFEVQGVTLKRE